LRARRDGHAVSAPPARRQGRRRVAERGLTAGDRQRRHRRTPRDLRGHSHRHAVQPGARLGCDAGAPRAAAVTDELGHLAPDVEAFLLELLGEAAVTIPELGTVRATHPPIIVLTSNRTRDLHDAVKRRCLYYSIPYPQPEREIEIVRRRVKGSSESLAVQVVAVVGKMRAGDVQKPPGIAEAIDW